MKEQQLTFGDMVKERRLQLCKTIRDLATELEVSAAYLCDIENGNRTAPIKLLKNFKERLRITEDEENDFYDLAYASHNTCAPDLIQFLIANKEVRSTLRTIIKENEKNLKNLN